MNLPGAADLIDHFHSVWHSAIFTGNVPSVQTLSSWWIGNTTFMENILITSEFPSRFTDYSKREKNPVDSKIDLSKWWRYYVSAKTGSN